MHSHFTVHVSCTEYAKPPFSSSIQSQKPRWEVLMKRTTLMKSAILALFML